MTRSKTASSFAKDHTLPTPAAHFKGGGIAARFISKDFLPTEQPVRQLQAALLLARRRMDGGRSQNRSQALMPIIRA